MNTRFKVTASYNILLYMCDFIHVLIFVIVSKCRKKSQINEYSGEQFRLPWVCGFSLIVYKKDVAALQVDFASPADVTAIA